MTGGLTFIVWLLLPKCPACLAAHFAFWTGVGLSFTEAAYLRGWALFICVALAGFLVTKYSLKTMLAFGTPRNRMGVDRLNQKAA